LAAGAAAARKDLPASSLDLAASAAAIGTVVVKAWAGFGSSFRANRPIRHVGVGARSFRERAIEVGT
jgi:hypothetical protein